MEQGFDGLMKLVEEVYEDWCGRTGNPGQVSLSEMKSAVAMMGDIQEGGKLTKTPEEARLVFARLLDELSEKSLYAQSRSMLPALTKGLPGWAKWLVLAAGVVLVAALLLFAERFTAAQGLAQAASYSIA